MEKINDFNQIEGTVGCSNQAQSPSFGYKRKRPHQNERILKLTLKGEKQGKEGSGREIVKWRSLGAWRIRVYKGPAESRVSFSTDR